MRPHLDMSYQGLESAEIPIPLFLTIEEYQRSAFHPDVDFVDGQTENRNAGDVAHSLVLGRVTCMLGAYEKACGTEVLPTCRLRVSERRIRVPDVMVIRADHNRNPIVTETPILCVEVIAPDDRWARLRVKLDDYLAMGLKHVWCFEPEAREVRRYTAEGFVKVTAPELTIAGTPIRINVAEVFSALDVE